MPLKLSVGLSRKLGLPRYGSAGATCLVEMELSSDALKESARFFEQAEKALESCRAVVEKELAYQAQVNGLAPSTPEPEAPVLATLQPVTLQGVTPAGPPSGREEGPRFYRERPNDRPATQRQLQAIERLALRLGANPTQWLHERIGDTPPHCLSLAEASALIDELQQDLPPRIAG